MEQKQHFWVGNKSGYVWAFTKEYKLYPKRGERFKYLGFVTGGGGWPKKLNTGRLLHKPSAKSKKKQRQIAKEESRKLREQITFKNNTMLS